MEQHPWTQAMDLCDLADIHTYRALRSDNPLFAEAARHALTAARWASVEYHRRDDRLPDEAARLRSRISGATRRLRSAA